MIRIDLLPPELRKKRKPAFGFPALPSIPSFTLVAGIAGSLAVIQLVLFICIGVAHWESSRAGRKFQGMAALKQTLDQKALLEKQQHDKDWVRGEVLGSLLWSSKLNQLSDAISSGIWLSRISVDARSREVPGPQDTKRTEVSQVLVLEGHALSTGEGEAATVARFVKSLKGSAEFMRDFSDVVVVKTEDEEIAKVPAMKFFLELPMKPKAGS